jgi:hypothetical protein
MDLFSCEGLTEELTPVSLICEISFPLESLIREISFPLESLICEISFAMGFFFIVGALNSAHNSIFV